MNGRSAAGVPERSDELREAVAFMLAMMIEADRSAARIEIEHAHAGLARCLLFAGQSIGDDHRLLAAMRLRARDDPKSGLVMHAAVLRDSLWRFAAIAMMADIMQSDGVLAPEELALMKRLADDFGISAAEVDAIVAHIDTDDLEELITGENLDTLNGLLPPPAPG